MPIIWPPSRPARLRRVASAVLILLMTPACGGPSPSRPVPDWIEEPSGVLRLLRSEGIVSCRGLVASSAPGSRSREAILDAIAREVRAPSSDPLDIAARVGRELAGPSAAEGPVDAATEGCLLGLEQGMGSLEP